MVSVGFEGSEVTADIKKLIPTLPIPPGFVGSRGSRRVALYTEVTSKYEMGGRLEAVVLSE